MKELHKFEDGHLKIEKVKNGTTVEIYNKDCDLISIVNIKSKDKK